MKERHVTRVGTDEICIAPYDDSRDKMYFVMQELKSRLPQVIIRGMPFIPRAVINKSGDGDQARYALAVEGYGLGEVMRTEGVDFRYTTTNHILEMGKVLGIEAARSTIISEIESLMGRYGIAIDRRHTSLLADEMTFQGEVLGIQRFGVALSKTSPL